MGLCFSGWKSEDGRGKPEGDADLEFGMTNGKRAEEMELAEKA